MYNRIRITTNANSSRDLIAMFSDAFDRLSEKARKSAPIVVTA